MLRRAEEGLHVLGGSKGGCGVGEPLGSISRPPRWQLSDLIRSLQIVFMGAGRIDGAPVDTCQANVAVDEVEKKKSPPINADTAPAIRLLEPVGEEKNICSGAIKFFSSC